MPTVRSRGPAATPKSPVPKQEREPFLTRVVDGVFHFLSSLQLAVMLLSSLAGVLAFATFYERDHGTKAVQLDIYQSVWFALLLAMLGVNILCAALIRFPWKKRQTGFVITHAGLIIVLIGSLLSFQVADEGRVGVAEGESSQSYYRIDHPVLRVVRPDEKQEGTGREYPRSFRPGARAWETDKLEVLATDRAYVSSKWLERLSTGALGVVLMVGGVVLTWRAREWVRRPLGAVVLTAVVGSGLVALGSAWTTRIGPRSDELSVPGDPFRLVVKDFLPSATEIRERHEPDPSGDGVPMVKLALLAQAPGQPSARDALADRGWVVVSEGLGVGMLRLELLELRVHLLKGERGGAVLEDFRNPPAEAAKEAVARIHYRDLAGKARVYDWVVREEEGQLEGLKPGREGKTVVLPESDLSVTLTGVIPLPTDPGMWPPDSGKGLAKLLEEAREATGQSFIPAVAFKVRKGEGASVTHFGWSGMPQAPALPPMMETAAVPEELVWIHFMEPATFADEGQRMMGRQAVVDVLVDEQDRVAFRSVNREGPRPLVEMKLGQEMPLIATAGAPMRLGLRTDEILRSGRVREVCEPLVLPKEAADQEVPAVRLELTAGGETKDFWLRRSSRLGPEYVPVELPGGTWQLSYDFDKRKLPCEIKLIDFEPSNDPGTMARSAFRSDVTVRALDEPAPKASTFDKLSDGAYFVFMERPRETFRRVDGGHYEPLDGGAALAVEDRSAAVQPVKTPVKITMNNPMIRDRWTFFQSSYQALRDRNDEPTGLFMSFFTARFDPAWPVIYGGCYLVIIGTFVQFYMRAGVFTDGGKKERARKRARAAESEGGVEVQEATASKPDRFEL